MSAGNSIKRLDNGATSDNSPKVRATIGEVNTVAETVAAIVLLSPRNNLFKTPIDSVQRFRRA